MDMSFLSKAPGSDGANQSIKPTCLRQPLNLGVGPKSMKLTPAVVGILTTIGAFAFYSAAINSSPHGWWAWYQLFKSGQVTYANVVSLQPANHGSCSFQYPVGSRVMQASDSGCSTAKIGDSIRIMYLPSEPSFATLKAPIEQLAFSILWPAFASVILGFANASRFRRRRLQRVQLVAQRDVPASGRSAR